MKIKKRVKLERKNAEALSNPEIKKRKSSPTLCSAKKA